MGQIASRRTDSRPPAMETMQQGRRHPETMKKAEEQVSDSDTIYPEKTTRAIVDCDGALNLRRSASWGNESICGRAVRGQSYYIKAIHTVEGKKMLETIDGIFLSGQPEHVRIIEV